MSSSHTNHLRTPVNPHARSLRKRRRRRIAIWSFLTIVGLSIILPLGSYTAYWMGSQAVAQESAGAVNERSNFWRAVNGGNVGYSSVKGEGANMLVQRGGNAWRELRNGPVKQYLPYLFAGMAILIVLYHLFHGRNKLSHELSGRRVKRWNGFERLVHWFTAISFIILAVTGLSMLFGSSLLIPLIGKEGFAAWAALSINVHNVVGPAFSIGIALMIVMWIWHNFPTGVDFKWLASGGGMFGGKHPSAGRMNAGEKIWFWLIATVGVAVCLSGLILVAPIYGIEVPLAMEARALMQQSSLIHTVAAGVWTAVALGHIYIGTAGTEGAFEGMATGYVSEEWARQHHDLWFEKVERSGKVSGYVAPTEMDVLRRQNQSNLAST
ncbi:MAG: formate dehydrogenase subunit gamma [Gammaproteobacteria bacterium]|nr:formate dehydrogenase subunit gamma [Gammaproteobacteria bacterium]